MNVSPPSSRSAEQTIPASTARRHDIDWLRVLVILVVFIFHSSRFFDQGGWHVKNGTTYFGVQVWITFLASWMMPFIFVVSGASTFYALGARGVGRFVRDRSLRLLAPLIVGIFTHIILQVYLERLTHGQFYGSFWQFIPHYFDGLYAFGGNFAWMGLHLWYLEVLFVFSLLTLPLFLWLKRQGGRILQRMDAFLAQPAAIYLLALPIMALTVFLNPQTPLGVRDFGGWSLVPYLFFYAYGFLLVSHDGIEVRIRSAWKTSLAVAVALLIALFLVWGLMGDPIFGSPRWVLVQALLGLSAWCWILVFWGLGTQRLTFSSPFLKYANEAVLPFYILHQTVLLSVGYFVVRWSTPDLAKWVIIASVSFAIIMTLYEFLVRRINLLRFLFGMRPLPRPAGDRVRTPVSMAADSEVHDLLTCRGAT
jgi:peptidoglycan/LPS O-acetylase OafA/YrhL